MTRWLVITLMAPLASFGERAGNAQSAFLAEAGPLRDPRPWRHRRGPIAAERNEDLGAGNRVPLLHRRQDEPGDRVVWQFGARQEFVLPQTREKPDGGNE